MEQVLAVWCTGITLCIVWPQVWHVRGERSVAGISSLTFLIGYFGCCCWIGYGLVKRDVPLVLSNVAVFVGNGLVIRALIRQKRFHTLWYFAVVGAAAALTGASIVGDPAILAIPATVTGAITLVPQTIHVLRTNRLEGISITSYLILLVALVSWVAYGLLRNDNAIWIANGALIPLTITIVARAAYTRRNVEIA